jgi:hypothetical protein
MRSGGVLSALLLLAACNPASQADDDGSRAARFPAADRPVAPITGSRFSTEEARDRVSEADAVMARAGVAPGMTVADIGAGEGYYTARRDGCSPRISCPKCATSWPSASPARRWTM